MGPGPARPAGPEAVEARGAASAPLDPSVLATRSRAGGDQDEPAAAGVDGLPSAEPLPSTVAQATPGATGTRRPQPGNPAVPSPPAPRTPAATQPRTPPARNPETPGRPAADLAQQVQFGRDGLVTMHTNELDVRQLLELLSRRSGLNILVSPKVTGTITANFEGVTVEQVLQAIIKLADLTDKQEGPIHYIYTKEELLDEAEFTKKERILTKVYKLNYVRADEILGVIRPFLSPDVGQKRISVTPSYRFGVSESSTFVSGGGQAMSSTGGGGGVAAAGGTGGPGGAPPTGGGPTIGGFQPPTGGNSLADFDHLIIQDYESNLQIIDQIIQRIDVRPIQVLIEAVIINVAYNNETQLGVNLGLVDNLGRNLATIGNGAEINGNTGFTPTRLLTASGALAQGTPADPAGFTSATNGIKFGFVSNNVTGFIRALETIGTTKILASPRILVLNKQRAEIQLGERLGFQTLSQNFTSTIQQVQFLNTGTLLRLRPFVSDDGMVRMEIHPERSSGVVNNNIPNQFTAELTTNVMVPDGATLVLGGLIEDEDDFNYTGLPGLSRFPALSFLTGLRQKTEARRELVVLLTPHIWSPEQAMAHAPTPAAPAAFGAAGPVANGAAIMELEVGRAGSGAGPAGTTGDPAGHPTAAGTGAGSNPGAAGAPAGGAAGAPASAGGGPVAVRGPRADPATSPRRRWSPLRDWIGRRPRDRQADPSANPGAEAKPSAPAPGAGPMPTDGVAAVRPDPRRLGPQTDAMPAPQDDPQAGPPVPSEQRPASPGREGSPPDLQPPPLPVGALPRGRPPRRDEMLAQTGWDRRRDEGDIEAPGRREPRPRRHATAAGETFASIARRYYGTDQLAESLRSYNRGPIRPGGPRPGDVLAIPPREELPSVGGWVAHAPSGGWVVSPPSRPAVESDDPGAAPRSGRPRRRPAAVYHLIGPDETPRSIARDRLGDARRAEEIEDLNANRLATEGGWRPGLRILLPPDAGPAPDGR